MVPSFLGMLSSVLSTRHPCFSDWSDSRFCSVLFPGEHRIYLPIWDNPFMIYQGKTHCNCHASLLAAWCTAQQQWNSTAGGGLLLLWKSDHFMLHHNFLVLSVFPSDKITQFWMLALGAGQGQRKLLSFHQHTTICVRAKKCGLWKAFLLYLPE